MSDMSTSGDRPSRRQGKGFALAILLMVVANAGLLAQVWPSQVPENGVLTDPVARLQKDIDLGRVRLDFDEPRGYLDSLLEALDIPAASQTLVFSKTSLQSALISPEAPRALYFNDDVYIGWVRDGPIIEVASTDPRYGTIFYTLKQSPGAMPAFEREGASCVNCHLPSRSEVPIPRLMVMSVMPNDIGQPVGTSVMLSTDRSPVGSRWGGWYVTGAGAGAAHLGNMVVGGRGPEWRIGAAAHLEDLGDRFDTSPYLSDRSDAVALMLLTHQAEVHNRIGEAAYAVRRLEEESGALARSPRPEKVREAVEPLVRALLFAEAAPFESPVGGSSDLAREFASSGPWDRQGRSLRDLDLQTRLLRHPLSYLVYSDAFDHLPDTAKDYVYGRLHDVLRGADQSEEFAHLSGEDRATLMEILMDTKPSFRAWIGGR